MNLLEIKGYDDDTRKSVAYSLVILSISKVESLIEEYEKDIRFCKSIDSLYLLPMLTMQCNQRKNELQGLKKYKIKLENGDFDKPIREEENEHVEN